jgi:hypothetical protein
MTQQGQLLDFCGIRWSGVCRRKAHREITTLRRFAQNDPVAVRGQNGHAIKLPVDGSHALTAIHKFLRFQIEEHKTGDPMEIR